MRYDYHKAIGALFELPPEIKTLVGQAKYDLHYGPGSADDSDYPGFTSACRTLRDWARASLPREVWYDRDSGEVTDADPGEDSPALLVGWRDILVGVFGSELSEYL